MIQDFERQQIVSGKHLSTNERLSKLDELLKQISDECASSIVSALQVVNDTTTDEDYYASAKEKLQQSISDNIFAILARFADNEIDETEKSKRLQEIQDKVKQLYDDCTYISSRTTLDMNVVQECAQSAMDQWFLSKDENNELKEKGYWANPARNQ